MAKRAVYGAGSDPVKVGPDRWRLRWSEGTDPFTGKHRRRTETISAKSITEARKELQARTSKRHTPSRLTFGGLIDVTLLQLPISERTRKNYGYQLAHIPDPARQWIAADMRPEMAAEVMKGLNERYGPQVVRKIHGALMACWRQARLNGWVGGDNPWRGQRLPAVPVSAGKIITDDEVAALEAACEDALERVLIRLYFDTGARPGEVCSVRWSRIDLDELVITYIDTKHKGRERPVALTATAAARIKEWQTVQRERALAIHGGTLDPDPYLISNRQASDRPWTVNYAGQRWRKIRTRAGVRDTLRPYDSRHTHNSWLAADNIDPTTRAERIGNSPVTNQRIYSHGTTERDREAAQAIESRRQRSAT